MGSWEGIEEVEVKVGGDEIDHDGEVLDGAEAAGFVLYNLDDSIEGFGGAIGDPSLNIR